MRGEVLDGRMYVRHAFRQEPGFVADLDILDGIGGRMAVGGALLGVYRAIPLVGCRRCTEALAIEARLIKTANALLT